MTRALGHQYLCEYGVIPTPTLHRHTIDESLDRFLLVCSDGLSDVLKKKKILQLVQSCKYTHTGNMQKLAEFLVKEALKEWDNYGGPSQADNITLIVVDLKALENVA
eukprot:TRINITY_DN2771_c0_g1_i7.p1 TRINITY_DN2771_c0_g1~~TRINITY_DN2771_c0_g1_i7.p1  ORF type:complete len:107 (+),score=18.23 TRINITY_DN2771_c0_g1_i7:390-710(+)